jgi:hypothetical protein
LEIGRSRSHDWNYVESMNWIPRVRTSPQHLDFAEAGWFIWEDAIHL